MNDTVVPVVERQYQRVNICPTTIVIITSSQNLTIRRPTIPFMIILRFLL